MAESAQDAFLLPRCSRRFPQDIGKGRPCLNAHIGKCMGVCSGKISCEAYNQAVKGAVHLIRYGKKDILKTLTRRMEEASERLEFETAALLRDQIAAITKVTEGQKVVVDEELEMDVVALAGTPDSVCAAVLRYRRGRLTDKREFVFHDRSDTDGVREEFLPRYYLDDEEIPRIIAVDALPADADALRQALSQKRGSEVQLYQPQRGDKARLVEMAHTNAVERLARERGRTAREQKLLDELAQVAGAAGCAPPDRELRYLQLGGRHQRLRHGGVPGRQAQQGRLPPVPDADGGGHRRLRLPGRDIEPPGRGIPDPHRGRGEHRLCREARPAADGRRPGPGERRPGGPGRHCAGRCAPLRHGQG